MSAASRIPILHVGNFLSSSGYNRGLIEDLADRLESAGWRVYRTSAFEFRPMRLIHMVTTIWLKRHQFSVGHITVFSGPAFIWAEAASWMMRAVRRPYVLSLHGGNLPAFGRHWPARVRRLLRSADLVVVPSPYLLEQMSNYTRDLLLVPNPIDLGRYEFYLRKPVRPRLLWMRAFHEIYNPSLAPKVLALLSPTLPELHLTMIGPCQGDKSLEFTKELARDLGVLDKMTLPGRVPKEEVASWLNTGDIFLNTTNVDNTPISILEAMACGLCIVSTNVGGIPYLLQDGEDSLLVPPDDPEAMAVAIRRLLAEPGLAERLSRNARKNVMQFDWSMILPRWEALFTGFEIEQLAR